MVMGPVISACIFVTSNDGNGGAVLNRFGWRSGIDGECEFYDGEGIKMDFTKRFIAATR